jgi:hypothetical protein
MRYLSVKSTSCEPMQSVFDPVEETQPEQAADRTHEGGGYPVAPSRYFRLRWRLLFCGSLCLSARRWPGCSRPSSDWPV